LAYTSSCVLKVCFAWKKNTKLMFYDNFKILVLKIKKILFWYNFK
jgi:hypothetical protein